MANDACIPTELLAEATVAPAFPRAFAGRYVLLSPLAAGGMGRVYLALSGEAGARRLCVVKTLNPAAVGHADARVRFQDEARIAMQLSSDNLVYVFDAGVPGPASEGFLAMELIHGQSLASLQGFLSTAGADGAGRAMPTEVATYVATQLLHALDYLHGFRDLNLVHRDLCPANVMLSYSGVVKVIDFGVASWCGRSALTQTGWRWGRVGYQAPEQLAGDRVDSRSDLFSVGVILWEMLTGRRLFDEDEGRAMAAAAPPPSSVRPGVPAGLDAIVARATALRPGDRFADAAAFCAAMVPFVNERPGKSALAKVMRIGFDRDRAREGQQQAKLRAASEHVALARMPEGTGLLPSAGAQVGPSARVGTVLAARYRLKRLAGQGGMGLVYEATDEKTASTVAIKVVNEERGAPEQEARLQREAAAAARIDHPGVAKVLDSGRDGDGTFFFAMEYVAGVELSHVIQRDAPMPLARVLRIGLQICEAVQAIHDQGVVHLDLKPSNIKILRDDEEQDCVKVVDFGTARLMDSPTRVLPRGELCGDDSLGGVGTPRYMAPEQMRTDGRVSARSDLYALCAIFYEMLSGHVPYALRQELSDGRVTWDDVGFGLATCRRKISQPPLPLRVHRPDLPPSFHQLLMSGLATEVSGRPRGVRAFAVGLAKEVQRLNGDVAPTETKPLRGSLTRWIGGPLSRLLGG